MISQYDFKVGDRVQILTHQEQGEIVGFFTGSDDQVVVAVMIKEKIHYCCIGNINYCRS
jgi:hypothetical protein